MGTMAQQPPMVIAQPATIITRHPATSNQLNINISVTRGLGMNYLWFTNPSSTSTKRFKKQFSENPFFEQSFSFATKQLD